MTWLVRLGTGRGKGAYVHRHDPWCEGVYHTHLQRYARRFELRDLAEDYARDYGGRVVRLTRPTRLWVVRLGKARGRGAYLHHSLERVDGKLATTRRQSLALRMVNRPAAVRRAADCGGRVVRLRRKR